MLYLLQVKDLETELESKKQIDRENVEQAISVERERFTQMQWDMEELRRKCVEMEFRFKAEQVWVSSYVQFFLSSRFRKANNICDFSHILRMKKLMLKQQKLQSSKRMKHCGKSWNLLESSSRTCRNVMKKQIWNQKQMLNF